ncbi:MAG: S1C family serine protease, partial [Gaiellaceae bacterium]
PSTDLAVLKVNLPASQLRPLTLAGSSAVQVGDGVVAIGSPFGLENTVTTGIVSALNRQIQAPDGSAIENAIQTDAAINHGNSGGPLLDLDGRVIGVNSQINSESGGNDGVGFAIPASTVRTIAGQLITTGKVQHGYLGVSVSDKSAGVAVNSVQPGSAAARAGLKSGDVITALDGKKVTSAQLRAAISGRKPGTKVELTLTRGGSSRRVAVTLGLRPA